MGLLSKLFKAVKFQFSHVSSVLKGMKKNPLRLLTGGDPLSTKIWNKALGTKYKPLFGQLGGATEQQFADYEAKHGEGSLGLARGLHTAAETVLSFYAGGALGRVAGRLASTAGSRLAGAASTGAQEAAHAGIAGGAGTAAASSLSTYARYAELGLNALSAATQISAAGESKKAGVYEQELTLRRQASERRQLIRDLYITRAASIAAAASNDEGALQSSSPIAANTSIFSQGAFNIKYFDAQAEAERLYKKYLNKAASKQETAGALTGAASIIGAFNQGS